MEFGPSCLVEELWRAPLRHPTSSRRWDIGTTWSKFDGGGTTALGAHGFKPLKVASGPEGSQIPSSPAKRHAQSGWRAWWKVEWGL